MKRLRLAPFALLLCFGANALGEDAKPAMPIYQQDPYDQITVDDANGGGTFKVMPLDLPGRQVPAAPKPADVLTVRMIDHGEAEAQIAWKNIAKLELFEQLVLAEAQRLSSAQEFEAAYDHFAFLQTNYPRLAGLAEATSDFRYRNAGALFRQGRHAEALMLLEAVHREEPLRSGLAAALANVSQPLFDAYRQREQFAAARLLVERTTQRGDEASLALVAAWQQQLASDARAHEQVARQQLAAGNFREANEAARSMLAIWPELPGGAALSSEISKRWPMLRIGVGQLTPTVGGDIPLERAAARTAMISTLPLVTLARFGPDGPIYESPLGHLTTAANRRKLSWESDRSTGYDIAASLLKFGDANAANSDPLWVSLVNSVSVRDVYGVDVELRRVHPQPLAVVSRAALGQRYASNEMSKNQRSYIDAQARGPREIVELAVPAEDLALADLRRGRLDIVERIAPQSASVLTNETWLHVGRYATPSIHVLVPNYRRTYPANVTFRRAIAYGIPRQEILQQELLGGREVGGCRTISGVAPWGENNEGWAYGCDRKIAPLAYEPRLALTLLRVADDEVTRAAQRSNQKPSARDGIVIGHGADALHRRACESMSEYLTRIGIACKHVDLSQTVEPSAVECDFWYVELSVHEPVVDLVRLFGRGGVIEPSAYLELSVADVMSAANIAQAQDKLCALHAIAHAEQTVIPLWQLVDHYACRPDLQGLENNTVSLYGNIDHWSIGAPPMTASRP